MNIIANNCKLIIFSSMRGHKISTPLSEVGVDHEFVPCESSVISIIKGAFKLVPLLIKRDKRPILLIDTAMNIGFVGWLMAKIFRVDYIYRARGDSYQEGIITKRYFHTWFYKKIFVPQAIGCIPVSYYLLNKIKKTIKNTMKFEVVNTPHLSCESASYNLNKRKKTILMVTGFGFITKIQSIFELLPTLKEFVDKHDEFQFLILGGGNHLESVIKYKEENYDSDAIIFAGHTSGVDGYYHSSYALLHITDLDAFPSVINEARACGLPVLASDLGGCSEQIEQGYTGLLFSNSDPISLLDALEKIMDARTWEELSVNGSEYVHSNHNIKNIGQLMVAVINKILRSQ